MIYIGNDHAGLQLKNEIYKYIKEELKLEIEDLGTKSLDSVDYPDIARDVGKVVASGDFDHGILICSTGIGISIAANKIKGIRAALCCDAFMAQRARQHNDANILCLSGDDIEVDSALDIVKTYLSTDFEGGRHIPRLNKIKSLEEE